MSTAPSILDYLNKYSKEYFEKVKDYLDAMEIEYVIDPNLVRGLDYYNHTAFEIMSEAEGFGAITTLSGGGRYTGLVKEVGGPETSGIGFAMSIERLLMALEAEGVELPVEEGLECFVVSMGDEAEKAAVKLTDELRQAGIQTDKDYLGKKMKGQFKSADRLGSQYVLVLGEQELENQVINVKDMATGEQKEVDLNDIVEYMKTQLAGGE